MRVFALFQDSIWRKSSVFVKRCFVKVNKHMITPKSEDGELRRKEFVLNVLLSGTVVLLSVLTIYVFYRANEGTAGIRPIYFACIPIVFCFYLFLSRRGFIHTSGFLFVCTLYIGATYGSFMWGSGMQMSLLTYVLIISMSSMLLGTLAGFISTIVISLTLIMVSWIHTNGIFEPDWYWLYEPDRYKAGQFVFVLFLFTIVSWLANREISRSLKQARESEENLRHERNQLEIRIVERTNELKKSQLEKIADMYKLVEFGRLSSGIFHDLMSPLNAVAICVEQLSKGNVAKDDIQKYVSLAVNASKRMHEFLNKAGKQIKDHDIDEMFSAGRVFSEVSELLNYKARLQGVRIVIDPTETLIRGNPLRFHQIANNLLSNSIDAFDAINEGTKHLKNVHVSFTPSDDQLTIVVADNGSGIPHGNLKRIFEPFFTTKSVNKGTGIGLSISKDIIEKEFQGRIQVQSTINTGTSFILTIPLPQQSNNDRFCCYPSPPTSSSTPTK